MSKSRVGAGVLKGNNNSDANGEALFPQRGCEPSGTGPAPDVEIPPEEIRPGAGALLIIPEETLDPSADDGGEPLEADPALMTVKLERPAPHSWVRLFPERSMRTVLLAHQPVQGRSAEYDYIAPELRGLVQQHLKPVIVYLEYDDSNHHSFLW